jgi:hypothetical protein
MRKKEREKFKAMTRGKNERRGRRKEEGGGKKKRERGDKEYKDGGEEREDRGRFRRKSRRINREKEKQKAWNPWVREKEVRNLRSEGCEVFNTCEGYTYTGSLISRLRNDHTCIK